MRADNTSKIYEIENQEWIDSIDYIIKNEGSKRVQDLIELLRNRAIASGMPFKMSLNTPFINTIPVENEVPYPGNRELERKIKSIIRWNAMAMVVQANRKKEGIGGHISTYASAATLYEVGFNHFFKGWEGQEPADLVYYQGHAAPGIYSRSFIEGRLSEKMLRNFRRELDPNGGLSSYPHPRSMNKYWQFPTVSMGLSPIMAIYQARFNHYLTDKGLLKNSGQKVWAFLGDGEMDEPESMGALTLASREDLDNLIFVINCNLQRLDGPVRGNGSIIQELEGAFMGAGWHVIKVVLGSNWDPLLHKDEKGLIQKRFAEMVDGQLQKLSISNGDYIRKEFFGDSPELLALVEDMSDEELTKLQRGGHDPVKVFNAYKSAAEHKGSPVVILAFTIKGYGLGEAGEGMNITHQQKKLNEEELHSFRKRFNIPISDDKLVDAPFYKPGKDSEEVNYLKSLRKKLGGFVPYRSNELPEFTMPGNEVFDEFLRGSGKRELATTMAAVQLMSKLLKDKSIGRLIVPIVPDESRTFGMDALFRQVGIYSHKGQLYEPVDKDSLLYYKETQNGAILEEGITEAGAMSSFIAAGTSYSTHGINSIPFFIFYSMFGFQRIGDLIWAAADARVKGFMLGGTSGRTTLAGEGLQHQDGQSHLYAMSVPSIRAYDPAFAYELAVIIREGIKRMYVKGIDEFYYITIMNEKYTMPEMPEIEGIFENIMNGMYKYKASPDNENNIHLLGSGSILLEVLKAAEILWEEYSIGADVWSVTSYKRLYDDAIETERNNRLSGKATPNFIQRSVGSERGIFISASDYVKAISLSVSSWFPGTFVSLGTDGFGISDHRKELRDHFEVSADHIVLAALNSLRKEGKIDKDLIKKAKQNLKFTGEEASVTEIIK